MKKEEYTSEESQSPLFSSILFQTKITRETPENHNRETDCARNNNNGPITTTEVKRLEENK
jgi:hypothetical protein